MSVPIVPIVPEGVGNTKPLPKQESPSKRWGFTLNNYSDKEYVEIIKTFSSNSSKYSIGKEVGEQGTPHLQGYLELKDKKRFTYLKNILPRAHIFKAKGNKEENLSYTQKEGDFVQNFKEVIYIEPINPKLLCVKLLMEAYEFPKGDRKIHVVVDEVGRKGKTEFCRNMCINLKDCIITGGKASDMKNQIVKYKEINNVCPKYILIDCPRSNLQFLSYTGIEEIKNMLFYSGKYEGGMVVGNKPFMCLFMNEEPDLDKMSKDRWNIIRI